MWKRLQTGYKQDGRDAMEDTFAKSKVSFAVLLKKFWVCGMIAIIEGHCNYLSNKPS